jgi:hypothetical protein
MPPCKDCRDIRAAGQTTMGIVGGRVVEESSTHSMQAHAKCASGLTLNITPPSRAEEQKFLSSASFFTVGRDQLSIRSSNLTSKFITSDENAPEIPAENRLRVKETLSSALAALTPPQNKYEFRNFSWGLYFDYTT